METKDIEIGQELTVGGVGWGERGEVVSIDDSVITLQDLGFSGGEFDIDKDSIQWIQLHA